MLSEIVQAVSFRLLIHENYIYFGAYRADLKKNGDTLIENWQTWKDPQTANPDFHVPASLGKLTLAVVVSRQQVAKD